MIDTAQQGFQAGKQHTQEKTGGLPELKRWAWISRSSWLQLTGQSAGQKGVPQIDNFRYLQIWSPLHIQLTTDQGKCARKLLKAWERTSRKDQIYVYSTNIDPSIEFLLITDSKPLDSQDVGQSAWTDCALVVGQNSCRHWLLV